MEEILSIGIDVGTTTTQIIFSKLTLKNTASSFVVPRVEITHKEILYRSEIYFTPILKSQLIDVRELKKIIEQEFTRSGFRKEDIYTGAVIVTGETARKQNAEIVLHGLSEFAGDFVVATAGPDLESNLAGYGSGAHSLSKDMNRKIVNFDIGGGTTNACTFDCGDVMDCYALDIGGRLIKFSDDGIVVYVSEKLEPVIKALSINLNVGQIAEFAELEKLTDVLAKMFVELIGIKAISQLTKRLFIEHEHKGIKVDFVTFSGGIAEYIYSDEIIDNWESLLKYGDVGPLLGYSIRGKMREYRNMLLISKEKIRATVIGAGNYSMRVSGSTITYCDDTLPIKNIPIIKISEKDLVDTDQIIGKMSFYRDTSVAIALKGKQSPSYEEIKAFSGIIIKLFKNIEGPIIVILENDFAKALGQTLKRENNQQRDVICLDNICAENGDYIDIGKAVSGVIPVIVKTLIFSQ